MILKDHERRNISYFAFFSPNSITLLVIYATVIEDTPIMPAKHCIPVPMLPLLSKADLLCSAALCDSWATCIKKLSERNLCQNQ